MALVSGCKVTVKEWEEGDSIVWKHDLISSSEKPREVGVLIIR